MVIGNGRHEEYLTKAEISNLVCEGLSSLELDGKRVLVLIPDATRTMPMPVVFKLFKEFLHDKVKKLDYLVALGTHQPLGDEQLSRLVGAQVVNGCVGETRLFNHEWYRQDTFTQLGTITADEILKLSAGLLSQDVPVRLNKLILDYDQILICGPVFPHEVAGFSGGNKYLFPGIAGPEIINFTHWLGALITSFKIIGTENTPVRAVIEHAAEFVKTPTACFAWVVNQEGVAGIYFGSPIEAWRAAAKLSASKHIIYKGKPYKRVLSIMPEMYADLWTAAKGMYKLEPVVADGGEVIIYAPHITEVSYTHGKLLDEIGYHCRDYYLEQWEQFKHYPGGVLAHSTHLKGLGSYEAATKTETSRIQVTLATSIPAERCRNINLGYLSPQDINMEDWKNREEEGILIVPHAGEMLYRLKPEESGDLGK